MFKKIVSMILICAMLIPLSSAVAADNTSVQPTIEEILNGYHEKAFEAQIASDSVTASAYSRQADRSSKTLEQETVDELTAAGYEAYNVTNENYNELEDSLKTDFSDLGLDPDGSYIVVISGEDPATPANSTRGSDLLLPPHVDNGDNSGGDTFTYIENDITYTMRYVTLVATDVPSELYVTRDYMLSNAIHFEDYLEFVGDITISIVTEVVDDIPYLNTLCTIASLIGDGYDLVFSDPFTEMDPGTLVLRSATSWTRSYIQIYNNDSGRWHTSQCSSYAVSRSHFDGTYILDPETSEPVQFGGISKKITTYSPFYNNLPVRKARAVQGFKGGTKLHDGTGDIDFYFVYPQNGGAALSYEVLFSHEESLAYLLAMTQEE